MKTKYDQGYEYAQKENGALANVYPEPKEPGPMSAEDKAEFDRGYDAFHEEQSRAI